MPKALLKKTIFCLKTIIIIFIAGSSFASDEKPSGPSTSFEALYVHRFNQDLSDDTEFSADKFSLQTDLVFHNRFTISLGYTVDKYDFSGDTVLGNDG
ncbi:MAG: hypothetical protein P9M03_06370, partial [Candidatus Theseobacter exili]|nr:hypothetical protein [Candidatus Theseobacter exili]